MQSSDAFDKFVMNNTDWNEFYDLQSTLMPTPSKFKTEENYRLRNLYEINPLNILNLLIAHGDCLNYIKTKFPHLDLKYLFLETTTIEQNVNLIKLFDSNEIYRPTELDIYHYTILFNSTKHLHEWAEYYGFDQPLPSPQIRKPQPPECQISREDCGFTKSNVMWVIGVTSLPIIAGGILCWLSN